MKRESGFTLIEIVMVLVLLGILSAVAVPKYFDLQAQAEARAAAAVVAEYQARLNAYFATELLEGKGCAAARSAAVTTMGTETGWGEWTVSGTLSPTVALQEITVKRSSGTTEYKHSSHSVVPQISMPVCSTDP